MKKCCGNNALRIAFGITILVLLLGGNAEAATLTVCPEGCAYSNIQKAIGSSSSGDTILVQRGTYFENVNINKKLTLRGIGDPVVDANGSGSAIKLSENGIILEGFIATGSGGGFYYESPEAGIKVTSNSNMLAGNNASNNNYGISLESSDNNTLTENNASNNNYGISLESSNNNTLARNNANSNNYYGKYGMQLGYGISLYSSSNNMLSGNDASNNGFLGIGLYSSDKNTLNGNNASNNAIGIRLEFSSKNRMSPNTMTGNQKNFDLYGDNNSDFDNHISKGNLVDGKPVYYLIKASNTTYGSSSNAGTLYCIGCINVTIKNLTLNKNGYGIYFWNTTLSKIQNVNASNNKDGISLYFSSNNTINSSNALSNDIGISLYYSDNNTLNENNVSRNWNGISVWYSNRNAMKGNNVSLNNGDGISLESSGKNKMRKNNVNSNKWNGISLSSSAKNMISANKVSSNKWNGISLSSSGNNKIYNNIFNNSNNFYFFDSNTNTWNTTGHPGTNIIEGPNLGGNFWADPKGKEFSQACPDENENGICDQAYILDENNIDYLPITLNFSKGKMSAKS